MTESEAKVMLSALEAALDGALHDLLQIDPDADVMNVCVAFASAATRYHPSRFAGHDAAIVQRATFAFGKLRGMFQQHIADTKRPNPALRRSLQGRLHPGRRD